MIALQIENIERMTVREIAVLRAIADALSSSTAVGVLLGGTATAEVKLGTLRDDNLPLHVVAPPIPAARVEHLTNMAAGLATIAPVDNPAAGADVARAPDVVFGAGMPLPNVPSQTPIPPPLPLLSSQTSEHQSNVALLASPPPPPPPALAPGNVSAVAPTTSNVPLDADGLPWNERIHAGTKTTNADGRWKKKRGVEADEVATVETQLRALMAIPVQAPVLTTGDVGAPTSTFAGLMAFMTPRIADGRLTQSQVTGAVQALGLDSLNLLMSRPDLIPHVLAALQQVAP